MPIWKIVNREELIFKVENNNLYPYLYFPLTNTKGDIFSCITPYLSGDIKKNRHQFLNYPATIYDLANPSHIRHIWFYFSKNNVFNLSPFIATRDKMSVEAGPLWYKFIRINRRNQIKVETLNFIPENMPLEVMKIEIENLSTQTKKFSLTTALTLFCRSEDNLRDHRHVTSLLNRIKINKYGIIVKPTMHFDERGHKENKTCYFLFAYADRDIKPTGFFPTLEEFLGPSFNWARPEAVFLNKSASIHNLPRFQGKEACGSVKFSHIVLKSKQKISLFLVYGISSNHKNLFNYFSQVNNKSKVEAKFMASRLAWKKIISRLHIEGVSLYKDFLLSWISLQPHLRKLFGCSFLPHFDYGKGGRGWRDLWQDLLLLLISEPEKSKDIIVNNFRGIRIDGSNATIIGKGSFIADRNNIPRVWSDHGVWPYLTLKLYINQTGDYDILFHPAPYFQDHWRKRAKEITPYLSNSNYLRTSKGQIYYGSILEHLLIENLVGFFNVGKHMHTLIEGADWNDALDMAKDRGETVTFSSMYADNLEQIACDLEFLDRSKKHRQIKLLAEIIPLLKGRINYSSFSQRRKILEDYLEKTKNGVEGKKITLEIKEIIASLKEKAQWVKNHIRKNEWNKEIKMFNGYYDNYGREVEKKEKARVRIMLPSQTFIMLSNTSIPLQAASLYKTLQKFLKDKEYTIFRLNTDFKQLRLDLGRGFGFNYGEKENGSYFSHMNVMLAAALIRQGLIKEGEEIINSLLNLCLAGTSKFYPNLPEYFSLNKEGRYFYLTGSASWLILVVLRQILGVSSKKGNLLIKPQFTTKLFPSPLIKIRLNFAGKNLELTYHNPHKKSWPQYLISEIRLNRRIITIGTSETIIERKYFLNSPTSTVKLEIYLK